MSESIEVTVKVHRITDTEPQPGRVTPWLVINAEGRSHSASRFDVKSWHGLPWDFGPPIYFTGNPRFTTPLPSPPPAPLTGRPLGGDDRTTLKCDQCGDEWETRARRCLKCSGTMKDAQQSKRQTGRTTRMLEDALRLAEEGRKVYVIFGTPNEDLYMRLKLRELCGRERPAGISLETPDSVGNFDWQTFRLRNAHPNCVVLVDHNVIERRFGKLFEMMTRYDAPRQLPDVPQPKPFTRR